MLPLEIGKLYSCSKYFLLLYPDKEAAEAARVLADLDRWNAPAGVVEHVAVADYWTKKLQKPVIYCNPETPLLILSADKEYVEVLAGDKRGWIINIDWLEIKEITDEAA